MVDLLIFPLAVILKNGDVDATSSYNLAIIFNQPLFLITTSTPSSNHNSE